MTDTITEAIDTSPALPTEEKATAAETAATWTCPAFKVSGVFSSHMVLQREKPIKIWGFSDTPGSRVAGCFMGETVTATVGEDNRFTLTFSSHLTECEPQIMVISDDRGHTVTFEDILVGDVWLIGGQSNAELTLGPCMALTPSMDFYEGDNPDPGLPLHPPGALRRSPARYHQLRVVLEETRQGSIPEFLGHGLVLRP